MQLLHGSECRFFNMTQILEQTLSHLIPHSLYAPAVAVQILLLQSTCFLKLKILFPAAPSPMRTGCKSRQKNNVPERFTCPIV